MQLRAVLVTMLTALAAFAALGACVPSRSDTFAPVAREARQRIAIDVAWEAQSDAAVAELLAHPLDANTAVKIALARSERLRATFEELGISAAEVAAATVLRPAELDFDVKFSHGERSEVEIAMVQDILDLVQLDQRRAAAGTALAAARVRAVAATVDLAARVEMAFYAHVAARQDLALVQTALAAAVASADLAERQLAAGNTTDLVVARERELRERLRVDASRAEQAVDDTRARLGALLGVAHGTTWTTIDVLPEAPSAPPVLDDLEHVAAAASLDSAALREEARGAALRHRIAVVRAFIPELAVGVAAAQREQNPWEVGPALRIGIPLFDQQQGPRARTLAEERRARRELAATQVEVAAVAEATRARARRAFAEVRQLADVVMPLRKQILDQTVLHYNAMNATPFELLVARRDQIDAARQYIDALRRYWAAMTEVEALRRGGTIRVTASDGSGEEMP